MFESAIWDAYAQCFLSHGEAVLAIESHRLGLLPDNAVADPRLFPDGDQWRALLGEDLQVGVAGFGDSPADAMRDFDKEWNTKLKAGK